MDFIRCTKCQAARVFDLMERGPMLLFNGSNGEMRAYMAKMGIDT
jgi:hypothetical protein